MSERRVNVLIYSSSAQVREEVEGALGPRPADDLPEVSYLSSSTGPEVVRLADQGGIHLIILDGEAWPTGGMGLARQLRDEVAAPPPTLLIVGRLDDAWLATWSGADAVVAHPIDAFRLTEAVSGLLRRHPALQS
ncbi:MAG: response regulator [Mycobacteriales bacterium]